MLCPPSELADSLLTQAFGEILNLDSYSAATQDLMIGTLPKEPAWLPSVRSRVGMLKEAGSSWIQDKPTIWGSILLQFPDYASAVAGVAAMQASGSLTTAKQWIEVMESTLLPQLTRAVAANEEATSQLRASFVKFQEVQPLLRESIEAGWAELASEERQMTAIASQLTHLQDLAASLEESITSGEISSGQSVITTSVKTIYNIAMEAGESFSFLSMAASAYTVGKTYYDIITKTFEVDETLKEIAKLQLEASAEAQAAAGTKIVLNLLYELQLAFASITEVMPYVTTMWRTEREKVKTVVEALHAGANPSEYLELVTFQTASANWQNIAAFAQRLPTLASETGPPVVLDPQNPLPAPRS
jgi:hypothetical protein